MSLQLTSVNPGLLQGVLLMSTPVDARNRSWVRNAPARGIGEWRETELLERAEHGAPCEFPSISSSFSLCRRGNESWTRVSGSPQPQLLNGGVFSGGKDRFVTTTFTNFCFSRPSRRKCPEGSSKCHQVIFLPNVMLWVEVDSHFFLGKCIYPYQSSPGKLLADESPKPATTQENAFC